jgi:hypothetical protein
MMFGHYSRVEKKCSRQRCIGEVGDRLMHNVHTVYAPVSRQQRVHLQHLQDARWGITSKRGSSRDGQRILWQQADKASESRASSADVRACIRHSEALLHVARMWPTKCSTWDDMCSGFVIHAGAAPTLTL